MPGFPWGLLGRGGRSYKVTGDTDATKALLADLSWGNPAPAAHTHTNDDLTELTDDGLTTLGDLIVDDHTRGLVLRDDRGKYYRVTTDGMSLKLTPLGPKPPEPPSQG